MPDGQSVQKSASETARYIDDTTTANSRQSADVLRALIEFGAEDRNTIDKAYIRRVIHHLGKLQ